VGALAISSAYANNLHNGAYAVHIKTRHGSCGNHHWSFAVSDG
jgi:hypothetical protein